MSAPPCAACVRLRATFTARQRIETAFVDLTAANDALLTVASSLSAALKQGMATPSDVYELLRIIHWRLAHTIAEAARAARSQDGEV